MNFSILRPLPKIQMVGFLIVGHVLLLLETKLLSQIILIIIIIIIVAMGHNIMTLCIIYRWYERCIEIIITNSFIVLITRQWCNSDRVVEWISSTSKLIIIIKGSMRLVWEFSEDLSTLALSLLQLSPVTVGVWTA